ncbi:MAG: hypothetical protein ABIZ70_01380 [Gemmatimonadales bacterium]
MLAFWCAASRGTAQAPSTRDSAGIQIVENQRPRSSSPMAIRLATRPSLVIGTRAGGAYEFSRIAGAVRLADHRIVIGDGASTQLRLYDSAGNFLRAFGRRGDGPGEFSGLSQLYSLAKDSILAGSPSRLSVFTSSGRYRRRVDPMIPPALLPAGERMILAVFAGGTSVMGSIPHPLESGHAPATGLRWTDTIRISLFDRHNAVIGSLAPMPARIMEWRQGLDLESPAFSPQLLTATSGQRWYLAFGSDYSIRAYTSSGKLTQIIRRQWKPEAADMNDWIARWMASDSTLSAAQAAARRTDLRTAPRLAHMPAFAALVADRTGRLWVRESRFTDFLPNGELSANPSRWSIFSSKGIWLADAVLPPRFAPTDIGADYVLGIARDQDGTEMIAMYGLRVI